MSKVSVDLPNLTPAQHVVLGMALTGLSNLGVAEARGCSVNTVAVHMAAIRKAYGVQTYRQVVAKVLGAMTEAGAIDLSVLIQAG